MVDVSEVIENYIRRHPDLSEKDAFDGFLNEERIKAWVGQDDSRKERLRKEFGRVWGTISGEGQLASGPKAGPSGPTARVAQRAVHVEALQSTVTEERRVLAPIGTPGGLGTRPPSTGSLAVGGGRQLQVLCTNCRRIDVWMNDDQSILCRRCGKHYDDMLQLIRITPVGPFEFMFGEGWKGAATAAGIVAGLAGLYFVLRGF